MHFQHSGDIWRDFPQLVPGVLYVRGITGDAVAGPAADRFAAVAKARLAAVPAESELPEIQAWRRAFAAMGLKPTQYRCASESLLRRFRIQGSLPGLHPLVDLCNAVSLAFAIPVAAFDVGAITWPLEVRYATGDEEYLTFAGEVEHPAAGEVIFADGAGQAHARRWTNRQSGRSAVRDSTAAVLVVAEALHEEAPQDVAGLIAVLAAELEAIWSVAPSAAVLTTAGPRFTFDRALRESGEPVAAHVRGLEHLPWVPGGELPGERDAEPRAAGVALAVPADQEHRLADRRAERHRVPGHGPGCSISSQARDPSGAEAMDGSVPSWLSAPCWQPAVTLVNLRCHPRPSEV